MLNYFISLMSILMADTTCRMIFFKIPFVFQALPYIGHVGYRIACLGRICSTIIPFGSTK